MSERTNRRCLRARSVVLSTLGLFALAQFGLTLLVHTRHPEWRDPLYGDKLLRLKRHIADRTTEQPPWTFVILGSSRTGFGFQGRLAETRWELEFGRPVVAFNFGVPAAGPVTELVYTQRLLREGIRPDLLAIEILPPMLSDLSHLNAPAPHEHHWLTPERLWWHEMRLACEYGFPRWTTLDLYWESVLVPWHGLRYPLVGRFAPGWVMWHQRSDWSRGTDETGSGSLHKQEVTPEQYARATAAAKGEYFHLLCDLRPSGHAARALRELLGLCQRERVPVLMVLMPEGNDFRSWYGPQVCERLTHLLNSLCVEYGCDWLDAREWVADRGFSDSHHLLAPGAAEFTHKLIDHITVRVRNAQ